MVTIALQSTLPVGHDTEEHEMKVNRTTLPEIQTQTPRTGQARFYLYERMTHSTHTVLASHIVFRSRRLNYIAADQEFDFLEVKRSHTHISLMDPFV